MLLGKEDQNKRPPTNGGILNFGSFCDLGNYPPSGLEANVGGSFGNKYCLKFLSDPELESPPIMAICPIWDKSARMGKIQNIGHLDTLFEHSLCQKGIQVGAWDGGPLFRNTAQVRRYSILHDHSHDFHDHDKSP
jgi:hypothetical protein